MKKFEGMLFCTDLDGTLYRDDKTLSRENREAIDYFKAEGGRFTFITGRVPATSREIYRAIRPNAPYGCINGAAIYDGEKEEYLDRLFLAEEALELVQQVDRELGDVGIQLNTEDGVYFCKDNPAMVRFRELTGLPNVSCPLERMKKDGIKIVFGHLDGERILALAELLNAHPKAAGFDFIRSEETLYEILPKGASKGRVLRKMAELLGIPMENTVAVGDYNNDISMLRSAGIGYAVANAVDEVKEAADRITVSNNESAIASIVAELERKRR